MWYSRSDHCSTADPARDPRPGEIAQRLLGCTLLTPVAQDLEIAA